MAAFLAVLYIDIRLHSLNSLKEKRAVIRPLRDKLKNGFNLSVIEVADNDSKTRASVLVVGAAGDSKRATSLNEKVIQFVERKFPQLDVSFENEVIQL
ncbi:MAG: DUF503 domain-containing protein [bacterium]|nr:DUF503 domain-containing protein [bacterium]